MKDLAKDAYGSANGEYQGKETPIDMKLANRDTEIVFRRDQEEVDDEDGDSNF